MDECGATVEQTEIRFSVRAMLLTMTAVAVAAGVLGICLRDVGAEARPVVLGMWGMSGTVVLGLVSYGAAKRLRHARSAGPMLCELAPRGTFGFARAKWMTILIGFTWVSLGISYLAFATTTISQQQRMIDPAEYAVLPTIVSGPLISLGIATLWWRLSVQLRETGVLHGIRLLRWSHVTKHEWEGNVVVFAGVDEGHRDVQIAAVAAADGLEDAKGLIERKLKAAVPALVKLQRTLSSGETLPAGNPLVPIMTSQKVTMRGLSRAAFVYVLVGIVLSLLSRPLGAPSREFSNGVFLAVGAVGLKLFHDVWRWEDSGTPLIRLSMHLDWPSGLVAVAVATGCFYVCRLFVFPHPVIGYSLGFCAGVAICALVGMMMRDKLDLCDNGVVLIRRPFLPWKRVRVLKWERNRNGAVLLGSGWRRIKARVPNEHREFVDRVLREKVGFRNMGEASPVALTTAIDSVVSDS